MLTNRKKLKIRRKKIKITLLITLFILTASVFLGYWIWINVLSKSNYISPLASKVLSADSEHRENEIGKLEELLREKNIEFTSINSSGTTYIIHSKEDAEIVISQAKDLNAQISSLQFILSRLTMEGKVFLRLDLTFDKPIIVFK